MRITMCSVRQASLLLPAFMIYACNALPSLQLNPFTDLLIPTSYREYPTERALAFGDYSEVPEGCPARTTCPMICVANETDCPTSCPDGQNLCPDGTCSLEECDESLYSLCACEYLNFTCAKSVELYDDCFNNYQDIYDEHDACVQAWQDSLQKVSFTGPWFIFCYLWISGVTLLVTLWCSYNQGLSPVENSTTGLSPVSAADFTDYDDKVWTQTGYKKHWMGLTIYCLVVITLAGFQFLLLLTTIFFYMQQWSIERWEPVFYQEDQVLLAFQLVWMIGIVWSLAFKWPENMLNLFLRRCTLDQATHVAVLAPTKTVASVDQKKNGYGDQLYRMCWWPFEEGLRRFFVWPRLPLDHELVFCEVDQRSRSFYFRMGRYVMSESGDMFIPVTSEFCSTIGEMANQRFGLSTEEALAAYQRSGPNIIAMAKPSVIGSILKEFNKPFYTYQNFIIWTWFNYWYYHMALIATFSRLVGGTVVGVFQYKCDSALYKLSIVEGTAEVIRDGQRVTVSAADLVPGDAVVLKHGPVFCDVVVVQSKHLVVDESVLTGESTPVVKSTLDYSKPEMEYNETKHKQHTIYAGANIIESGDEGDDLGLVIATGSSTKKGQLLSDMLSYQRHKFQFDDEIKLVMLLLILEAIVLITLVFQFLGAEQYVYAWFYSIYVMSTVCPPLLATVFVVSVGISADRLRKKKITCTYSEGILVAGKVNVCCFDKTGTLTQPNMTALGVEADDEVRMEKAVLGMAVCHSLKVLENGEIVGNEVDRSSFQFTNATIDFQKGEDVVVNHLGRKYTILKQFTFDNHTATQSVLIGTDDGKKIVFVKGSPEAIRSLCNTNSIPKSFDETLRSASESGIYQLGIAWKEFGADKDISLVTREEIELSLTFCGIIKFRNELKPETKSVMEDLQGGNILITMITGDHVLTGIRVAREAGICLAERALLGKIGTNNQLEWVDVDLNKGVSTPLELTSNVDLALTGEAWARLLSDDPVYAKGIAKYVRVFGRCNPMDKVSVVMSLVELGCVTLMCGDGQNDCGALKSAHIGVALSSSEASVVAPFTSIDKSVSSVTAILLEGRCALSSAFKVYSFYMMYGQIVSMMQVMSTYLIIDFADWTWIFLDGIWSLSLSFTLPLAAAARRLTPCRPTASVFGPRTMFSICGMLAFNMLFLVISMLVLFNQDWFQCRKWDKDGFQGGGEFSDNYESSVIAIVGSSQVIGTAVALNFGYTFRAPWYKNYIFALFAIAWIACNYVMTLYPSSFSCIWRINCDNDHVVRMFFYPESYPINNPFNTTVMPVEFRRLLAILVTINYLTLIAWEYFFVNGFLYKKFSFGKDEALNSRARKIENDDGINEKAILTSKTVEA